MNKTILLLLPFLLSTGYSQWVQTPGLYAGWITALTPVQNSTGGTDLFAAGNGVFLSTDSGLTWCGVNNGLPSGSASFTIVSYPDGEGGNNIFTAPGWVYRSTDHGSNWIRMHNGLGNNAVYSLLPKRSSTGGYNLFASILDGSPQRGVFISTNDGADWSAVNNGLMNSLVYALGLSPDSTLLFAGTSGGLFVTSDDGGSWNPVNLGSSTPILAFGVSGTSIFAGTMGNGIYRSDDNGLTWTPANNGLQSNEITCFASTEGKIFAGTSGQDAGYVYLSTDNGENWVWVSSSFTTYRIISISIIGTKVIAGTTDGIFVSSNFGNDWIEYRQMSPAPVSFTLQDDGLKLFSAHQGGLYSSSNNGHSWEVLMDTTVRSIITIPDSVRGTLLFAGTWGYGVLMSTDSGFSWSPVNNGLPTIWISVMQRMPRIGGGYYLFAGTSTGVFRSDDSGSSWTAFNTGLSYPTITCFTYTENILYAGTNYHLFRSTDYGETWSAITTGMMRVMAAWGSNLIIATNDKIFITTNNGQSWSDISISGVYIIESFVLSPREDGGMNIFASGTGNGVYFTTDLGASWINVNEGMINADGIPSLGIWNGYIFAGVNSRGIWKRPLSEIITSAAGNQSTESYRYQLYQNFPNPFNSSTSIIYSLSEYSEVNIKIFNILGMELTTLINEPKHPGEYSVNWDAGNLPTGVYFCRLKAGTFMSTMKMVLVR